MKTKEKDAKKFNYWKYFAKYKLAITLFLVLVVIDVGLSLFSSIYGAYILVDIASAEYMGAIKRLIILLIVAILSSLFSFLRNSIYFLVSTKVINAMRVDIAIQTFKISDKAYADHKTANFTQRISSDPSTIFNNIHAGVLIVSSIISALALVVYISVISPIAGFIAVTTVVLIISIEKVRKNKNKKNKKHLHDINEKGSSLLNEIVRSEKDIKSLNLEQELNKSIVKATNEQAKQQVKTSLENRGLGCVRNVIMNIMLAILTIVSLVMLDVGMLTLSMFMIIYNNKYSITNLSNCLGEVFDYFAEIELASMRINELFEDDEYELEKFGSKTLTNVKGEIEFKNVSFGYVEYREKSADEIKKEIKQNKKNKIKTKVKTREISGKNQVFNNLSFKIEPNTSVAFVGKSGTGKSTILNLISKMYEADKGKVLIDGVDVKKLSKESLRSSISLVNQFPYIFDMTIKENMLLAKPNATEKELQTAIKQAALDEFIDSLPSGLNTKVGESGIKLSGGQKQRVAIARAMLRKSPIIIFDESTSSLDNIAQAQIKESIDSIKGKSTVVIVAHRLSTIKNVDKIFFLEDGEIIDSGTFKELYKRNKSFKQIFLAENV